MRNAAIAQAQRPTIDEIGQPMKPVVSLCEGEAGATIVSPLALTSVLTPAPKLLMSSAVSAGCAAGGFDREVRHPAGGVLSRSVERNRLAGTRSGIDRVDAALRQPLVVICVVPVPKFCV
jgi:hypothetical protein